MSVVRLRRAVPGTYLQEKGAVSALESPPVGLGGLRYLYGPVRTPRLPRARVHARARARARHRHGIRIRIPHARTDSDAA